MNAMRPEVAEGGSKPAPGPRIVPAIHHAPNATSLSLALAQVERCQAQLREREALLHALREEVMLLKQVERKQSKDIELLEADVTDAPHTIAGLRGEVERLKKKIKSYYAQINLDSRHIRQITADKQALREEQARLHTLIQEKGLGERHTLKTQLAEAFASLEGERARATEATSKLEMVERNLYLDNKQLRARATQLEREVADQRARLEKQEETLREREKEIASLTIYRFHAVHRKAEGSCKVCKRREREEQEMARRNAILEKLPVLTDFTLSVLNPQTVQVSTLMPEQSDSVTWSRLHVLISDRPGMAPEHTRRLVVDQFPEAYHKRRPAPQTSPQTKRAVLEASVPKCIPFHCDVGELESGKFYYFQVSLGQEDVEGKGSDVKSIIPDILPAPPAKPMVEVKVEPSPRISLYLPEVPANGCSKVNKLRIYHSHPASYPVVGSSAIGTQQGEMNVGANTLTGTGAFQLLAELPYEGPFPMAYTLEQPAFSVEHRFAVSAVNGCGESMWSECSDPAILDLPPNTPHVPRIMRLTDTVVQVESGTAPNAGSPVQGYRLEWSEVDEGGRSKAPQDAIIPVTGGVAERCKLLHVLHGLTLKSTYRFRVQAVNQCGESDYSDFTNAISIDALLNVPPPLIPITVVNESKAVAELTNVLDHMHPQTTGLRILCSATPDMRDPVVLFPCLALTEQEVELKFPVAAECYFVACCYLGDGAAESLLSAPTFLALATAFPLPESTPGSPTVTRTAKLPSSKTSSTHSLGKAASRSIMDMRASMDRLSGQRRDHSTASNTSSHPTGASGTSGPGGSSMRAKAAAKAGAVRDGGPTATKPSPAVLGFGTREKRGVDAGEAQQVLPTPEGKTRSQRASIDFGHGKPPLPASTSPKPTRPAPAAAAAASGVPGAGGAKGSKPRAKPGVAAK